MTNYWLNILSQVGSFVSTFVFFTLALSFWGRQGLRLSVKGDEFRYGDPLTLAAGGAILAFSSWVLTLVLSNLRLYLLVFLYSGAFLAILEIVVFYLPIFLRQKDKFAAVKKILQNHELWLAGVILAGVLSFFYAAIWPSGRFEVWLFGSVDYLNWALLTDYWLGADPKVLNFTYNSLIMTKDSFGAQVLFAAYALAAGQTALWAVFGFMGAMVVGAGLVIHWFLRRIFGLGFWVSLALTLGVTGGAFYNFLIFKGLVGQLVGSLAYLVALREMFQWPKNLGKKEYISFFWPIFWLFLAYQGAFIAYVFFLVLAGGIRRFCLWDQGHNLVRRIGATLWGGLKPVALTTGLCFILTPFMAFWLIRRSFETATQTEGWQISFLSPWLLSGLPIYRVEYFTVLSSAAPVYWYFIFFLGLFILGFLANRLGFKYQDESDSKREGQDVKSSDQNVKSIKALILIFSAAIVLYFFGYYFFDNRYQVWKFISYVGLPLAFIYPALIIFVAFKFTNYFIRYVPLVFLAAFSLFWGIGFDNLKDLTEFPEKFYKVMSARTYLAALRDIITRARPGTYFQLNLMRVDDAFFGAEFFKFNSKHKFSYTYGNLHFSPTNVWPYLLTKDSLFTIISDRNYQGLFNGELSERVYNGLFVFDRTWLNEHGYAKIYGILVNEDWAFIKNYVLIKILAPKNLWGQKANLNVALKVEAKNTALKLSSVSLSFNGQSLNLPLIDGQVKLSSEVAIPENGFLMTGLVVDKDLQKDFEATIFMERVELKPII
ncbi:MAG: hypothetical protein LBI10_05530 [Deltaproteobacteria bacterium]|jgi:hypothetical protein|nr:hypothetical protein [Deltaproteobacteria bacterium]